MVNRRSSLLRLRDGETGRGLFDFETDLLRNLFQRILHPMSSIEICPCDQQQCGDNGCGEPAPQAG